MFLRILRDQTSKSFHYTSGKTRFDRNWRKIISQYKKKTMREIEKERIREQRTFLLLAGSLYPSYSGASGYFPHVVRSVRRLAQGAAETLSPCPLPVRPSHSQFVPSSGLRWRAKGFHPGRSKRVRFCSWYRYSARFGAKGSVGGK